MLKMEGHMLDSPRRTWKKENIPERGDSIWSRLIMSYELGWLDLEASSVTWAATLAPRGHHRCMRIRETFMWNPWRHGLKILRTDISSPTSTTQHTTYVLKEYIYTLLCRLWSRHQLWQQECFPGYMSMAVKTPLSHMKQRLWRGQLPFLFLFIYWLC